MPRPNTQPRLPIGHTILRFDEVGSTNTLALETEEYLGNHGLVLVAQHQTAGRGRLGRAYASVPGTQLQFSVVLHPKGESEALGVVSLAAGVAVTRGLYDSVGIKARLKWPNDVYLGGRKLCGILSELRIDASEHFPRLVLGIGINCNGHSIDFPKPLHQVLTTVAEERGAPVNQEQILQSVLSHLGEVVADLEAGKRDRLLAAWRSWADYAERPVLAAISKGWLEGTTEDIGQDGELIIRLADGRRHIHSAGEVRWLP